MINMDELKQAYRHHLLAFKIKPLQAYARSIGVDSPTKQNKDEVILSIIAVRTGEIQPIPLSTRGAPVKNTDFDANLPEGLEEIDVRFMVGKQNAIPSLPNSFDYKARINEIKRHPTVWTLRDPDAKEPEDESAKRIYKGQIATFNGVSMLLPLDGLDKEEKFLIPVELIRQGELEEGDVITCYAEERGQCLVATDVLTVNERVCGTYRRKKLEESALCFPEERLHFYDGKKFTAATNKYLEWLIPFGKGQRGLIIGPPKSGKSTLFLQTANAAKELNDGLQVFVLLVGQSPENVGLFRKQVPAEHFVYTTYEEEPERQIFLANLMLSRAVKYAECGNDVLLLVDSINALASAYNDTEESSGGKKLEGGLESKTVQYIKKYLGTARCFDKGGSITILGALSCATGNPADEGLFTRLSPISGLDIVLSGELAKRRIYPAVDYARTRSKDGNTLASDREVLLENKIRDSYLPANGQEALIELLKKSQNLEEFEKSLD
ncbi:MAG: hypothetical protein IKB20_02235 [Clostridia bacterium]|nr:hypothetical protein [Clostridia bacterium]